MREFGECLANGGNGSSIASLNAFCQGDIRSNITARLESTSGSGRIAPSFGLKSLFWVSLMGLILSAQGTTIPSLSTNLSRRQSSQSGCSVDILRNYTTIRSVSSRQSGSFPPCTGDIVCAQTVSVDTGILENNRTVNGTSAAEPMYDAFFDRLEEQTGRAFPALSSAQLEYEFISLPNRHHVAWTPFAWCAEVTTDCAEVVGETDQPVNVDACGPLFVSEVEGFEGDETDDTTIQGVLGLVITG